MSGGLFDAGRLPPGFVDASEVVVIGQRREDGSVSEVHGAAVRRWDVDASMLLTAVNAELIRLTNVSIGDVVRATAARPRVPTRDGRAGAFPPYSPYSPYANVRRCAVVVRGGENVRYHSAIWEHALGDYVRYHSAIWEHALGDYARIGVTLPVALARGYDPAAVPATFWSCPPFATAGGLRLLDGVPTRLFAAIEWPYEVLSVVAATIEAEVSAAVTSAPTKGP